MKKEKYYKYLVFIPLMNLFLYFIHTTGILSDVVLGAVTGFVVGLSVLLLIIVQKNIKRPKSFKENIKNKLLTNLLQ